jgi:peptidoglycan/LPS O-acetylase OafA/YrhL
MTRLFGSDGRLGGDESAWHDLIRCLLIAQVVFGHFAAIALPSVPDLMAEGNIRLPEIAYRFTMRFGPQAAYLFVVLSGVMVGGGLVAALRDGILPSARAFFRKRMNRILPISVLAVLATAFLDILAIHFFGKEGVYQHANAYDMVAALTWPNFFGNLLFLQPVVTPAFGSNGPLWTLGYIVQFYVVAWILARLYLKSRIAAILLLLGVLVGMCLVKPEWSVLFIGWLVGGFARFLAPKRRLAPFALVSFVTIFVASNLAPPLVSALLSIPVGILVIFWAKSTSWGLPVGWRAGLRSLSSETYAIYAVHYPVAIFWFALALGTPATNSGTFFLYVLGSIIAVTAASVLISKAGGGVTSAFEAANKHLRAEG